MKKSKSYHECLSWNCCDELLFECIDKSRYVKKMRNHLKKKKLKQHFQN